METTETIIMDTPTGRITVVFGPAPGVRGWADFTEELGDRE